MQDKIVIRNVAVYHPQNVKDNEFFIKHFEAQGIDVSHLLQVIGRDSRYMADENETSLSMATEASKKVLEHAHLKGEDLDMIIFVSGTPEYLFPPNAVSLHQQLHGKMDVIAYDMNVACVGMVVAVSQASRVMMSNPHVKRALVVGAERMQRYARKEDPVPFASFGDAACAVILEKQMNTESGFIDSHQYTNTESLQKIMFPACGLSNIYNPHISDSEKLFKWENVRDENGAQYAAQSIIKLLDRYNLTADDITVFCLSQLSKKNILNIKETLNQPDEKFILVGQEFGYTGTSSPFIALERAISEGKVQRGDYIVFWSVGAGTTACSLLFKY